MTEITLLLIAAMIGFLVNKFLNQRQQELDRNYQLNTKSAEAEISAAIEDALKKFDDRINNTWSIISSTKQELETLKLQIGLKRLS
jgi:uncharacterized protein HemX